MREQGVLMGAAGSDGNDLKVTMKPRLLMAFQGAAMDGWVPAAVGSTGLCSEAPETDAGAKE